MPSLETLLKLAREENPLIKFRLFARGDDLPPGVRLACRTDFEPESAEEIFAMGFHRSREWLYSEIEATQPQAYAALLRATDFYLLLSQPFTKPDRWGNPSWFVESGGRLIQFELQASVPRCSSLSRGVAGHGHYLKAVSSLGHDLARAYCSLIGGMSVPTEIPEGLATYGLPRGVIDWQQAYIAILTGRYGIRDWINLGDEAAARIASKELGVLAEMFGLQNKIGGAAGLTPGLRCFIDTRVEDSDGVCDFILVQTPVESSRVRRSEAGDPLIYRVKNHDWENIQVVREPSRAIDSYVAHALSNRGQRFDFDPYCATLY